MNDLEKRKINYLKQRLKRESIDNRAQLALIEKARSIGFGDSELIELERVYGLTPL